MKKIFLLALTSFIVVYSFGQQVDSILANPPKKKIISLNNRSNDHFLLQLGYTNWAGRSDTMHIGGFSKSVNVYFMLDLPFKTNPKLSVAFGPGFSTDQIAFKKTYVGIKDL